MDVERRSFKPWVGGSSPPERTTKSATYSDKSRGESLHSGSTADGQCEPPFAHHLPAVHGHERRGSRGGDAMKKPLLTLVALLMARGAVCQEPLPNGTVVVVAEKVAANTVTVRAVCAPLQPAQFTCPDMAFTLWHAYFYNLDGSLAGVDVHPPLTILGRGDRARLVMNRPGYFVIDAGQPGFGRSKVWFIRTAP